MTQALFDEQNLKRYQEFLKILRGQVQVMLNEGFDMTKLAFEIVGSKPDSEPLRVEYSTEYLPDSGKDEFTYFEMKEKPFNGNG